MKQPFPYNLNTFILTAYDIIYLIAQSQIKIYTHLQKDFLFLQRKMSKLCLKFSAALLT